MELPWVSGSESLHSEAYLSNTKKGSKDQSKTLKHLLYRIGALNNAEMFKENVYAKSPFSLIPNSSMNVFQRMLRLFSGQVIHKIAATICYGLFFD